MLSAVSSAGPAWSGRKTCAATLVVAAVVGAFGLAYLLRGVLLLLFIAILLSTALKPFVARLRKIRLPAIAASIVVYGLMLLTLVAAIFIGLPLLAAQASEMLKRAPDSYRQLHEDLSASSNRAVRRVVGELPNELPRSLDLDSEETTGAIQAVVRGAGYGGAILHAWLAGLATILLAFYWSLNEERAIRACLLVVPAAKRDASRDLIAEIQRKLGAYLRGQSLLCLIMAGMVLVVYGIIGLPYVVALAVAAGCLEALPVFGPILGAVPALLVALSVSPGKFAWTLGAIVVMQQIEGNVLVPRIMDRSVGISAITTLLAIVALSTIGGLVGAVLAIPCAAIVQLLFERWLLNPEAGQPPANGRDGVSRLRYQAQQLAHDLQLEIREKAASTSPKSDGVEEGIEELAREADRFLAAAVSSSVFVSAAANRDGDAA